MTLNDNIHRDSFMFMTVSCQSYAHSSKNSVNPNLFLKKVCFLTITTVTVTGLLLGFYLYHGVVGVDTLSNCPLKLHMSFITGQPVRHTGCIDKI